MSCKYWFSQLLLSRNVININFVVVVLIYLKPVVNVTFLSDNSFLEVPPAFSKRTRGFAIGLSFKVPPDTSNGLLFWEAHRETVGGS